MTAAPAYFARPLDRALSAASETLLQPPSGAPLPPLAEGRFRRVLADGGHHRTVGRGEAKRSSGWARRVRGGDEAVLARGLFFIPSSVNAAPTPLRPAGSDPEPDGGSPPGPEGRSSP
ncbi:MAG: hypothetical protein IPP10_15190 [Candidatus Competibacteraceae bacterium]|nr:hypothetical protein [Candidatus Competibacteraceae bacterium]